MEENRSKIRLRSPYRAEDPELKLPDGTRQAPCSEGPENMKRSIILFTVFLLLTGVLNVCAQDQPGLASQLPNLLEAVPDPAQVLGAVGSLYQEELTVYDIVYNSYLFPRTTDSQTLSAAYTEAAENAGYTVEPGTMENYSILRVTDPRDGVTSALLFPDYQGYVLLLVPPAMNFTLHDEVPASLQPAQLIEMGNRAISEQDYQSAIRYLIKAAGMYLREQTPQTPAAQPEQPAPTPTPTPVPPTEAPSEEQLITHVPQTGQTGQIYVVREGDSCWSIAAQFGMDISDFMAANNFTECNIQPNDEVVIPEEEIQEPTATPLPGAQRTYVVESGDNCWSIAVDKFGVNFELFMSVNNLTECNILVGQEVIIPGADQQMPTMTPIPLDQYTSGERIQYVVEMNDSYNDIAAKFNTTLLSIQQLNNVNVYTGYPMYGQVLTIAVNLVTPTPTPEPTAAPEIGTLAP